LARRGKKNGTEKNGTAKARRTLRKNHEEEGIFFCWVDSKRKTLPASG
jgi:hypothetical protein